MFTVAITLSTMESENQWDYMLTHFQPDHIVLLNDYQPSGQILKGALREFPDDSPKIFFTPKDAYRISGEISLVDFVHPEHATYIFGSDHEHTLEMVCDQKVYIPLDDKCEMYSWTAAAIVFWDRLHG